jgi:hypothetical protein
MNLGSKALVLIVALGFCLACVGYFASAAPHPRVLPTSTTADDELIALRAEIAARQHELRLIEISQRELRISARERANLEARAAHLREQIAGLRARATVIAQSDRRPIPEGI